MVGGSSPLDGLEQELRLAERGPACTASFRRLMAADTMVALEREKYFLDSLRCSVWREVRDGGVPVRDGR